ncbi:TPA: hypothetical protein HA241_05490 [Candidatus Woesearchaeota archaeon]|nr:hypothetical protein [Candidatus Woesearchaeota archaeon]
MTTKNLEYKIGNVGADPSKDSKFIVHLDDEKTLGIYSVPNPRGVLHKHIAKKFGLRREDVLGGGEYYLRDNGTLELSQYSTDFGSIPAEAERMVGETLANYFRKEGLVVNRIATDMIQNFDDERNKARWEALGFNMREKNG